MLSLIIWFAILSSGSVLCSAIWKRRYEEVLPITCSIIVFICFLCGLFGKMPTSVWVIITISIVIYIFSVVWVVKHKSIKEFIKNIITPAFWGYISLITLTCIWSYGRLASSWDEFSHWADIVKVFSTMDTFGTNPLARSAFAAYPPGMTLFQYFLQKIYQGTSGNVFSEWRMYVAYSTMIYSFMCPFLKKISYKKILILVLSLILIWLCPTIFFASIYTSVYIDPYVGILSGVGLATIYLSEKKDNFYSIKIWCICSMLVLAKDAGLVFAIFLLVAYVWDFYGNNKVSMKTWKNILYVLIPLIGGGLSVAIPKWLWNLHLKKVNAPIMFSQPYKWDEIWNVITGVDESWKRVVWIDFWRAVVNRGINIGNTGIKISYLSILVLFFVLLCVVTEHYKKSDTIYGKRTKVLVSVISIQSVVYIVGICLSYISKFSEYEAIRLASFERYINVGILSIWVVIFLLWVYRMPERVKEKNMYTELVVLWLVVTISPMEYLYNYTQRVLVSNSIATRSAYSIMVSEIEENVPAGSGVYLVSQADAGFDYWVLRYSIRPCYTNSNMTWSIGEAFFEGDIWTKKIKADEWKKELLHGYDYVALFKLNQYFIDEYSCLFAEPDEIEANTVYKINKDTSLLEKCE